MKKVAIRLFFFVVLAALAAGFMYISTTVWNDMAALRSVVSASSLFVTGMLAFGISVVFAAGAFAQLFFTEN